MILPNPSNANEAFVFSRSDYGTISIGRGMFVMLRAATKSTIMHVQMHQITMLSTVRSPSILDGLRFARLGSSEFMNVVRTPSLLLVLASFGMQLWLRLQLQVS